MSEKESPVVTETSGKLHRGDKVTDADGTETIVYTELPGTVTVRVKEAGDD